MTPETYTHCDKIIFEPADVDLSRSPLRVNMKEPTFVLGAFNPGLCRLANGNLLLMVRIAESLQETAAGNVVRNLRWEQKGFVIDSWPADSADLSDPRVIKLKQFKTTTLVVTSLSWLLPVELSPDGQSIQKIHYDKAIIPECTSQEYGIEDPRISSIGGRYYMTVCCVSSERHSTMLYSSGDGLHFQKEGIILDHQNKDMLIFEGTIGSKYYALTRPLGECYFAPGSDSAYLPGATMQLASSPDLLHWKPSDEPFFRSKKNSNILKTGGGTPPVLTQQGWLMLFHGVLNKGEIGVYKTYWALLDKKDPTIFLHLQDETPLIESKPKLTDHLSKSHYVHDIVFTTGIVSSDETFVIASGEVDLACRITVIEKEYFLHAEIREHA